MSDRMPLDGVVVADFSRVLAGPLATATLADLGATVIKVERRGQGDDTRAWGPPWTTNSSSYFQAANRNKKSIELDLSDAADLRAAVELANRADILVENFRDGTLGRYGLGYEQLTATNPGLIYVSVTGFGSKGGAHLPGYDFLVQAVGGLMSITGHPETGPTKVGVALVDILTAKDAVVGALAALRVRDTTGEGQRVEVNLLSSLLGSLANQASAFLTTGESPTLLGNAHPSIAPYETLEAKDGQLALCVGNDAQFVRFASEIGQPELATDTRFATNAQRVHNREALVAAVEPLLRNDTVDAWTDRLNAAGIPAGRISSIAEAIQLAERLGLEPTVEVGDAPRQVRSPISFSRTPITTYDAPPTLGQHSTEIRRWLEEERA
ncbi:crotonobetainyl-CoA:carnitine CoA-transferase CaiB-like acyl-CoA transferase [Marmoricola sp. URHA0025 HA25]